jgi:hypothetical protein
VLLYRSRLFRLKAHPIALRGWVVYPEYPIKFVVQITIEVPKDTIFIKPGYKKY